MNSISEIAECINCGKDLNNVAYIKCAECNGIILCPTCFRFGAEGGSHKRTHSYFVNTCKAATFDPVVFHEGESSWNGEEELRLLDAVEIYGVGNWTDIANKVTSRTAIECQRHYERYFLEGVLGDMIIAPLRGPCRVTDHTVNDLDEPPSVAASTPAATTNTNSKVPPARLEADEEQLLGYMPKRDDFEREYDNDAESILCRLHPSFEKDDLEEALKIALGGIYAQRVQERQRRKQIAKEHDLISQIMAHIMQRRRPVETTTMNNNINSSTHFHSHLHSLHHLHLHNNSSPNCGGETPNNSRNNNNNNRCRRTQSSWFNALNFAPSRRRSGASLRGRSLRNDFTLRQEQASSTNNNNNHLPSTPSDCCYRSANLPTTIDDSQLWLDENTRLVSTLYIDEKLKALLRYMSRDEARQFLENLRKEETLRSHISDLIEMRKRGKTLMTGVKLRVPRVSEVYTNAQKCDLSPVKFSNSHLSMSSGAPHLLKSNVRRSLNSITSTSTVMKKKRRRNNGSYPFSLSVRRSRAREQRRRRENNSALAAVVSLSPAAPTSNSSSTTTTTTNTPIHNNVVVSMKETRSSPASAATGNNCSPQTRRNTRASKAK